MPASAKKKLQRVSQTFRRNNPALYDKCVDKCKELVKATKANGNN